MGLISFFTDKGFTDKEPSMVDLDQLMRFPVPENPRFHALIIFERVSAFGKKLLEIPFKGLKLVLPHRETV